MREELDKKLCEKYPKIFADRYKDMQVTAMCWGFGHSDGWYTILNHMCHCIQSYIDWKNRDGEVVPQVVADQVKEKFGTLRFYYTGGDDYVRGIVSLAESMSGVTCEECGHPGESRSGGWVKTLCEQHEEERQERLKERLHA